VEIVLGLVEDRVSTRCQVRAAPCAGLLGDGEIAGGHDAGLDLVHSHVGGGAATVPIVDSVGAPAELLHDRPGGIFVGAAPSLSTNNRESRNISCFSGSVLSR